jgi:hypothetical protein
MKKTVKTSVTLTHEDMRILNHLSENLRESRTAIIRRALLYFYMYKQEELGKKTK